ncbi:MAG: hypothetical protein O3C34_12295 [Proteobacteria bacterium]|nr:hypothetical protein [Pseudomonadota bacterium]
MTVGFERKTIFGAKLRKSDCLAPELGTNELTTVRRIQYLSAWVWLNVKNDHVIPAAETGYLANPFIQHIPIKPITTQQDNPPLPGLPFRFGNGQIGGSICNLLLYLDPGKEAAITLDRMKHKVGEQKCAQN